jgi:hypothetical protein
MVSDERTFTAAALSDLFEEFRAPGQPLHGLEQSDAERIFAEVVEQLVLRTVEQRRTGRAPN